MVGIIEELREKDLSSPESLLWHIVHCCVTGDFCYVSHGFCKLWIGPVYKQTSQVRLVIKWQSSVNIIHVPLHPYYFSITLCRNQMEMYLLHMLACCLGWRVKAAICSALDQVQIRCWASPTFRLSSGLLMVKRSLFTEAARCAEDGAKLYNKGYSWYAYWGLVVKPADKQVSFIYALSKLLLGIVNTTMAPFGPREKSKTTERLPLLMGDFQVTKSRLWVAKMLRQ